MLFSDRLWCNKKSFEHPSKRIINANHFSYKHIPLHVYLHESEHRRVRRSFISVLFFLIPIFRNKIFRTFAKKVTFWVGSCKISKKCTKKIFLQNKTYWKKRHSGTTTVHESSRGTDSEFRVANLASVFITKFQTRTGNSKRKKLL